MGFFSPLLKTGGLKNAIMTKLDILLWLTQDYSVIKTYTHAYIHSNTHLNSNQWGSDMWNPDKFYIFITYFSKFKYFLTTCFLQMSNNGAYGRTEYLNFGI